MASEQIKKILLVGSSFNYYALTDIQISLAHGYEWYRFRQWMDFFIQITAVSCSIYIASHQPAKTSLTILCVVINMCFGIGCMVSKTTIEAIINNLDNWKFRYLTRLQRVNYFTFRNYFLEFFIHQGGLIATTENTRHRRRSSSLNDISHLSKTTANSLVITEQRNSGYEVKRVEILLVLFAITKVVNIYSQFLLFGLFIWSNKNDYVIPCSIIYLSGFRLLVFFIIDHSKMNHEFLVSRHSFHRKHTRALLWCSVILITILIGLTIYVFQLPEQGTATVFSTIVIIVTISIQNAFSTWLEECEVNFFISVHLMAMNNILGIMATTYSILHSLASPSSILFRRLMKIRNNFTVSTTVAVVSCMVVLIVFLCTHFAIGDNGLFFANLIITMIMVDITIAIHILLANVK